MKFEINSEVKIQISFNRLKNSEGGKIHIYYFSGERYQHSANWGGKGCGNIAKIFNIKGTLNEIRRC